MHQDYYDRIKEIPLSQILPFCIKLKESLEKMRFNLTIQSSGLFTAKILVINPLNNNESVECNALIDTGSELTIICSSIYNQFNIEESLIRRIGISTMIADEESAILYPFQIKFPSNNWQINHLHLCINDLSSREEYRAIIGMNVLKDYNIIYLAAQKTAYLEY